MKIKPFVIERFAKFLLGGSVFTAIQQIVSVAEQTELSGDEKRKYAFNQIVQIGYDLADWLVNLGIELAVAWLNERVSRDG